MQKSSIAWISGGGQTGLCSNTSPQRERCLRHSTLTLKCGEAQTCHPELVSGSGAFTLAEVLITLGIIGIVAAMTLPALVTNYKHKELYTALVKDYSVIQQAMNLMAIDEGEAINRKNFSLEKFAKSLKKGSKTCLGDRCVKHDKFDDPELSHHTNKYRNYNNTAYMDTWYIDDGQFLSVDGTMYFIENSSKNHLWILVDVNGEYKKPNRLGHDVFTFVVLDSGKVVPMGANGTINYYCNNSSNSQNGMSCTYKALTDKDYWKNLPK